MTIVELIITGVEIWGSIGLLVAALFLLVGIDRIDPASNNSYAFRPLLIPGVVVIWPLVVWRWWSLEKLAKHGCPSHPSGQGKSS